jgi:hypothetical protein
MVAERKFTSELCCTDLIATGVLLEFPVLVDRPPLCWCGLNRPPFVLGRAEIAQRRVAAVGIVEALDEVEDGHAGLAAGSPARASDELAFEAGPFDLSGLAELSGGDVEIERELLQEFGETRLEDKRSWSRPSLRRPHEIRHWAYRIKFARRAVGATSLADAGLGLEQAGEYQDLAAISACKDAV